MNCYNSIVKEGETGEKEWASKYSTRNTVPRRHSSPTCRSRGILSAKMMKTSEERTKPKRTGWKITGYIFAILTILLSLSALRNIAMISNFSSDPAESVGRVIGALLVPIVSGFLARYFFRKARNQSI